MMIFERWIKIRPEFMKYLTMCARNTLCFACTHEVIIIRLAFLPARASEQGNLIGLVSVYIYIYIDVIKKKIVIERTRDLIYLKFVATDFSPKISSLSTGENSGDSV